MTVSLLGAVAGVGAGAALGIVHAALRPARTATWAASDWAADVLPPLAFAIVTGLLLDSLARA